MGLAPDLFGLALAGAAPATHRPAATAAVTNIFEITLWCRRFTSEFVVLGFSIDMVGLPFSVPIACTLIVYNLYLIGTPIAL